MKSLVIIICVIFISVSSVAQFKSQVEQQTAASQSLVHPTGGMNSFLGLLNLENFHMRHNFSYSYISFGGVEMSLASYTNSMFYKIADPLNVRFDLTLQGSPFYSGQNYKPLNGLMLSRAELNYRPWENFFIKLEYNQLPANFFNFTNPLLYDFSSTNTEMNNGH